ncbi:nuclear pore complex protein nup153-like [Plakobranchus ocellatus]|uniref:Nuclear pore complex protein Nup153 n=1 Tax=Plakobranchus ocellatus TaxID=259542 RepID=A0AAV4A8S6_9GAST|nr:nuclear pore complex protein nup153-like [Plakobranchus ocellatus]
MSGEGAGKIKPKRTHQSKKPYERSTSFLGKIKDSVKDLLIPSWLVRSSDNVSETASGPLTSSSQFPSRDGYNNPRNQSSSRQASPIQAEHLPHFNELPGQHPRLSFSSTSGQSPNTSGAQSFHDDAGPAPNVNIATIEQQQNVSWYAKEQESPIARLTNAFQQQPKKKPVDPAHLRMSDSYLEESVDVSHPPSQIMMSTNVIKKPSSKPGHSMPHLWSPDGARLQKALVPPVKDKPAFNAFLFASPSKNTAAKYGDSSFYSGKTCYGGSSARRKKNLNTSLPYQTSLPLRKQVTANKMNSSLNATTSSTAQRILETLDRMSTPLGDARKIPQDESTNDSIISFTPSSYRRTSSVGSLKSNTRPLQVPGRGPPTVQHQALSQAELARNRNKVTGIDRRQSNGNSDFIVSQEPSIVRNLVGPSDSREPDSSQALPTNSSGKLKSKKFSQHMTNRKDESDEVLIAPNLRTDFTLPITNINPISLTSRPSAIASSMSSIPTKKGAAAPLHFKFSTPIEQRRPSASNQSLNNSDQGFKFSSPIKASQSKINAAGAEEGSKTSPEPAVGASSVLPAVMFSSSVPAWGSTAPKPKFASPDIGGTSSSFKSYSKWSGFNKESSSGSDGLPSHGFSLAPAASLKTGSVMDILGGKSSTSTATPVKDTDDLMAKFKKPAGSWDCDTCMLNNKPEAVKCIACETLKPGTKSPLHSTGTDDLMAKFKKPAGSWDCDTCMLNNKPEAIKCVACETPKPGAKPSASTAGSSQKLPLEGTNDLMAMFKKPAGTWECNTCMLSNKPEASKCIACEVPKPGAAPKSDASNNSLSAMFKKTPGNWECDTCLVQNLPSASRCVACDSPKPGLESAGMVSKMPVSSDSGVTLVPGGGFVINSVITTTTVGSCGFKFGNSNTSSAPSTSLPAPTGFVFGQTGISSSASGSTTTSSGLSAGFKFGSLTVPPQGQNSGATAPSLASGFTFGNQKSDAGLVAPTSTNPSASYHFDTASLSSNSENVSSVVEVTPAGRLNSNTNGLDPYKDSNTSSSLGFVFGGISSSSTFPTLTNSTPSPPQITTTSQPQINISFAAPKIAGISSATTTQSSVGVTETSKSTFAKPASGLFQFGATPASSLPSNSTGLGMGSSLTSGKAVQNGGFGMPGTTEHTTAAPTLKDNYKNSEVLTFGGFGQNTFSSAAEVSGQAVKRVSGFEETVDTNKPFSFGSTSKGSAVNGGFHFGGAAQSHAPVFGGSAAAASPSSTPGGFIFGSSTKTPQLSGPAAGSGFHFTSGQAGSAHFNFGQAAAPSKSTFEPSGPAMSFKAGGPTPDFNFGGTSQTTNAPFQFGTKLAESASSAPALHATFAAPQVPQSNGPNFGGASGGISAVGSFNLGVGETSQRKVKRAVRRIHNKK